MTAAEEQCPIHLCPHPTHASIPYEALRDHSHTGEDVGVEGVASLAGTVLRSLMLSEVTEIMIWKLQWKLSSVFEKQREGILCAQFRL